MLFVVQSERKKKLLMRKLQEVNNHGAKETEEATRAKEDGL